MPKEVLDNADKQNRKGPPEVYATLRDLIAVQHQAFGFSFLPKFAVQSLLSGKHRSKLRGRGLDFEEVRKYVAGDDIRNIDWKVTARVGITHTKEFTEERERPVFIITDQTASMFFGSQKYFKSVTAAKLAALACWRVLDQSDRCGGMVFNDSKIEYVAPKRNRNSVQQYLKLISAQNHQLGAQPKPEGLENPMNETLRRANELIGHDYLVVLISDLYTADQETVKQLIRLKKNNDVIIAQISDPAEATLGKDRMVVTDGEYQTVVGKNKALSRDYAESWQQRLELIKATAKKYGMPYLNFSTLDEPATQLRDIMSDGAKQRR